MPLPWSGDAPPFGFSPPNATAEPWLPQPVTWRDRTVEAQEGDPDAMLTLYRQALAARRAQDVLGDGPFAWLPAPDGVLAFSRGTTASLSCVVNVSPGPVPLPVDGRVVLASGPLSDDGLLPTDTTVWLVSD